MVVKMAGGVSAGPVRSSIEKIGMMERADNAALAGAAATITSDALMNPFDGMSLPSPPADRAPGR